MLALLHTARVHVETFERLAHELGNAIPIRHEVQEGLLADALKAGLGERVRGREPASKACMEVV
jgi:hypothetical protein